MNNIYPPVISGLKRWHRWLDPSEHTAMTLQMIHSLVFIILVLLGPISPKDWEDYVLVLSPNIVVIKFCLQKA